MSDRTVSVDFVARHAGFTSGVQKMKREVTDLRGRIAESARQNAADWERIGRSSMVAGGVMAAGLGAAVHTFHGFQTEMNRVGALTGATGEKFEELGDLAKELGRTTVFTASESADALGFLAMAGFDADTAMQALPNTLTLAAAAGMDLAQAADITTNILTGFGMETDQLARANDALVATFTNSNTSMEQLGEAMKYAAPLASAAGIEFEEAAAAIGLMGNAGIQGSMAGTSLRGALTRLLNPTAQVQSALDRLGISVTDTEGGMLPLADIVEQLSTSGADAGDMMQIFGQRAGPALVALVSQGAEELRTFTGDLRESGGAAEDIADRQLEGLHGSLTRFKSAAEGAAIALGEGLAPAVGWLADRGAQLLSWVGGLPSGMQTVISTAGALTAGVLLLGGAFMIAVPKIVALHGSFLALTGSTSLLAAAKSALATAQVGAYVGFTNLIGLINPWTVAIGVGVAAVGGLIWWLAKMRDEQIHVGDAAETLAESVGLTYEDMSEKLSGAGQSYASASQEFAAANADVIRNLRELDDAAASDLLITMAFDLVQHGADPDEAMAAVERLAAAADRDLKLNFDASDLNGVEAAAEAAARRIGMLKDQTESSWFGAATGQTKAFREELEHLGEAAGATFLTDPVANFAESIGYLASQQEALSEASDYATQDIRRMLEAFADATGISGSLRGVGSLEDMLGAIADGSLVASEEVQYMAEMFVAAQQAGLDTGDALERVAYLAAHIGLGEPGDDVEGFAESLGMLGDEIEGLEGPTVGLEGALADLGYTLDQLGGDADDAAQKWNDLGQEWYDLAGEFLDASQAMTRAQEENQTAAEQAAAAHNAAIDDQIKKLGEGEHETREALEGQKKSWEDFADDFPVTMEQVTDHLEDVNEEFRTWQSDIQTIAENVGGDFATRLAMMGPEWAPIVSEAVDATAGEIYRLDQAMADNIALQLSAAKLAVQMEILEEAVRQGGKATAESIAEETGIAVEVVEEMWEAVDLDPIDLSIAAGAANSAIDGVRRNAKALEDEDFIAWVDANIDPFTAQYATIEELIAAYQESDPTADLFVNTGEATTKINDVAGDLQNLISREYTVRINARYNPPSNQIQNMLAGGSPIGRSHSGDVITSGMPGRAPGLAADERLRILQVGEEVVTARDPRHIGNLGRMHTGGVVAQGGTAPVMVPASVASSGGAVRTVQVPTTLEVRDVDGVLQGTMKVTAQGVYRAGRDEDARQSRSAATAVDGRSSLVRPKARV